jgi:hypothetical protein
MLLIKLQWNQCWLRRKISIINQLIEVFRKTIIERTLIINKKSMRLRTRELTSSFLLLRLIFEADRMFYVLLRERACHVHTLELLYAFFWVCTVDLILIERLDIAVSILNRVCMIDERCSLLLRRFWFFRFDLKDVCRFFKRSHLLTNDLLFFWEIRCFSEWSRSTLSWLTLFFFSTRRSFLIDRSHLDVFFSIDEWWSF